MAEAKNEVGEEILSDPSTDPKDRAKQPTESDLKQDDKASGTSVGDAEPNDPPVRTNRPDVPIVQRLGKGAGEHTPLQDDDFDSDGRFSPDEPVKTALQDEKVTREQQKQADAEAKAADQAAS